MPGPFRRKHHENHLLRNARPCCAVDGLTGRGHRIYGLAQGIWDGAFPGSPALPKTGQLVQVRKNGKFKVIVDELDTPTSMQFIGDTAYVVTLNGEIWKIRNVSKLR